MSFELRDGVWETAATAADGPYTLQGKVDDPAALHAFGDVLGHNDRFFYRAWAGGVGEEEGHGQYESGAPQRVHRVEVYRSTNGDAAVVWPNGTVVNLAVVVGSGVLEDLLSPDWSPGFAVRRGPTLWTPRSLVAGAGVAITNANGAEGDPQISVPSGPGSGLDADTLDGQEATAFAPSDHAHQVLRTGAFAAPTGNSRMLRYSSGGTLARAANTDDPALLEQLYARGSDGEIYLPGSLVPWSGVTPGERYWLAANGALTSSAPTESSIVTLVYVGRCDVAGHLSFAAGGLVVEGT